MADETQSSSGFSWFLAGLGIGALIGVLYAPKAGKETREDLAASAREGTEYLRQRSKEATEQINQIVDRGKAQVSEYVDRGKEYIDRGRAQWDDFVAQSRQFVNGRNFEGDILIGADGIRSRTRAIARRRRSHTQRIHGVSHDRADERRDR